MKNPPFLKKSVRSFRPEADSAVRLFDRSAVQWFITIETV